MNYIVLYIMDDEGLKCGDCENTVKNTHIYITDYKENDMVTGRIRCVDCFNTFLEETI